MKSITNIGYNDDITYYQSTFSGTTANGDFDSVFETETTVYATPTSSETQINAGSASLNTLPVTTPAELDDIFKRAAQQYGISENLLKAVAKAESNFNPNATSGVGAMGVMQLMPATASYLGVDNAYDAEQNIMGGAKYLAELLNKYNGNVSLALAGYNAGPGNVDKYNGIPPFEETQNYVQKVLNYMGNVSTATTTQTGSDATTTYIVAIPQSAATQEESSVATIYAIAANDVTNPAKLYMD